MTYCLDTSAWLEYFNAGPHGPAVRRILAGDTSCITPAIVAAQIVEAARLRGENSKQFLEFMHAHAPIVPVTSEIARIGGKVNARRAHPPGDWSLLESLLVATARVHEARIVTLDPLFADVPHVVLLDATRDA